MENSMRRRGEASNAGCSGIGGWQSAHTIENDRCARRTHSRGRADRRMAPVLLIPVLISSREHSMPAAPTHCTFCDLVHGAGEVSICYEDAITIAFMDIQPVNPGHTLVVPRQHYESLVDIPHD